ncbi:MAG: hypothetical protein AAFR37_17295 [Cyanobacteria bacterium J06628_3]
MATLVIHSFVENRQNAFLRFPPYVSFPDKQNREQKHQYGWFTCF